MKKETKYLDKIVQEKQNEYEDLHFYQLMQIHVQITARVATARDIAYIMIISGIKLQLTNN